MNSRGVYCDTNRHSGEGRNPGQFSGGDKPHAYLFGDIVFVVAGFIPACKGQKVEKATQFRKSYGNLFYKIDLFVIIPKIQKNGAPVRGRAR